MTLIIFRVEEYIGYSTYILCIQPAEFLCMYIPIQLLPGQDIEYFHHLKRLPYTLPQSVLMPPPTGVISILLQFP